MQQSTSFIALVLAIYAVARIYFYFAFVACDKAVSGLGADIADAANAAKEGKGGASGQSAWLWQTLCFLSVTLGLAAVYYAVPGGGAAVDAAVRRLAGDLPEILWKASEKDVDRIQKRGSKLAALFFGYFCILYILELSLRGVAKVAGLVYRKIMRIKTVPPPEEGGEDVADTAASVKEPEAVPSTEDSDDEGAEEESGGEGAAAAVDVE